MGLIFLAGGLVSEVYAIAATPDALQEHIKQSRFGKGPHNYASYPEEYAALEKLINPTGSVPSVRMAVSDESVRA